MRISGRSIKVAFNHHPFNGQGASLYVAGLYRNQHVINGCSLAGVVIQGTDFPIAETNVKKTARVDFAAGTETDEVELTTDLSAYNESTVTVDVRHYKDDVECETTHPQKITLDASGDVAETIRGAYSLNGAEVRAGGVVRVRFTYIAALNGIAPETFEISRTAGPTSPTDVSIEYAGSGTYEIDTAALSDASAYTFDVIAENDTQSVSRTLGEVTFTADATGPDAATSATAEAY